MSRFCPFPREEGDLEWEALPWDGDTFPDFQFLLLHPNHSLVVDSFDKLLASFVAVDENY
jgi:hypothetical protein